MLEFIQKLLFIAKCFRWLSRYMSDLSNTPDIQSLIRMAFKSQLGKIHLKTFNGK